MTTGVASERGQRDVGADTPRPPMWAETQTQEPCADGRVGGMREHGSWLLAGCSVVEKALRTHESEVCLPLPSHHPGSLALENSRRQLPSHAEPEPRAKPLFVLHPASDSRCQVLCFGNLKCPPAEQQIACRPECCCGPPELPGGFAGNL